MQMIIKHIHLAYSKRLLQICPFQDAYSNIFTARNGDRAGVPNIAIVLTDGQSTNRPTTLAEAKKLRDTGAQVSDLG